MLDVIFVIKQTCLFISVPNLGQDRDGICRSWGQHHFETFDGMYYYFPGTCSYILAKDCHSPEPQYTVWVSYRCFYSSPLGEAELQTTESKHLKPIESLFIYCDFILPSLRSSADQ